MSNVSAERHWTAEISFPSESHSWKKFSRRFREGSEWNRTCPSLPSIAKPQPLGRTGRMTDNRRHSMAATPSWVGRARIAELSVLYQVYTDCSQNRPSTEFQTDGL